MNRMRITILGALLMLSGMAPNVAADAEPWYAEAMRSTAFVDGIRVD